MCLGQGETQTFKDDLIVTIFSEKIKQKLWFGTNKVLNQKKKKLENSLLPKESNAMFYSTDNIREKVQKVLVYKEYRKYTQFIRGNDSQRDQNCENLDVEMIKEIKAAFVSI